MTDIANDEFFTKKHAKLTNIAFAANIFAWIVIIVHMLLTASKYMEFSNSYGLHSDFVEMLKNNPLQLTSVSIKLLSILIHGFVYFLVLKGISSGLYMIVETNLNLIDTFSESTINSNIETENNAVFYQPKEIVRLTNWIDKAIIIIISITFVLSLFTFPTIKNMVSFIFVENELGANIFAAIIILLNILIMSAFYYFSLRALKFILKVIMEIEFNSRQGNKNA